MEPLVIKRDGHINASPRIKSQFFRFKFTKKKRKKINTTVLMLKDFKIDQTLSRISYRFR